jgi:hypothetical protein
VQDQRRATRHRIDVVGLQELQRPQWQVFRQRAREYRIWPGPGDQRDTDNSIAWRAADWRLLRAHTIAIPYFDGKIKHMPVLLLQHRATGRAAWFATFHNPASLPWLGSQRRHREEATRRQATLARTLQQAGYPVFVTGDMNDTRRYYCPFVRGTGMHAANGGTVRPGSCTPPRGAIIDWVFGSPGVTFTGYTEVRGPLAGRTSDHPLVYAGARLG